MYKDGLGISDFTEICKTIRTIPRVFMLNSWQFDFGFSCNCLLLSITLSLPKGETKDALEHSHSRWVQLLPHLNTRFAILDDSIN